MNDFPKSIVLARQCQFWKSLTSCVLGSRQLQDGQPQPSSIPSSSPVNVNYSDVT